MSHSDSQHILHALAVLGLSKHKNHIHAQLDRLQYDKRHGTRAHWEALIQQLPSIPQIKYTLHNDTIELGNQADLTSKQKEYVQHTLRELQPWRKGPFCFFDMFIDTEWRSDWKWNRLKDHITPLTGRRVLDVGCGSGYHCWRMRGAGAKAVLGIDPSQQFWFQFQLAKHFIRHEPVFYLPIPLEDFPANTQAFDTVFSMGVLYHRRAPFTHLERLRNSLRKGGQLVLETLITHGDLHHVFVPPGRYAQMRNVFFLPSPDTMIHWLKRSGFHQARVVDITPTTTEEQRSTEWMQFQSLENFLHPEDPKQTIEGHPAPVRAVFLAEK